MFYGLWPCRLGWFMGQKFLPCDWFGLVELKKLDSYTTLLTHTVMECDRQTDGRTDSRCIKVRLQCVERQQRHTESCRLRQSENIILLKSHWHFLFFPPLQNEVNRMSSAESPMISRCLKLGLTGVDVLAAINRSHGCGR